MRTSKIHINLIWITIFSVAMGYLESAVVVYLRAIYYPDGFTFPMVSLNNAHLITEIGREVATMVMLVGIGILNGKSWWQKFAVFLYSFAIWDIFYYVFLKLLLNWPESLLTWDLLFLIPTVWSGPVLAPGITSLIMILYAVHIIYIENKQKTLFTRNEVVIIITGALITFVSYTWDFISFLNSRHCMKYIFNFGKPEPLGIFYIPVHFPWWLFVIASLILILPVILSFKRIKKAEI